MSTPVHAVTTPLNVSCESRMSCCPTRATQHVTTLAMFLNKAGTTVAVALDFHPSPLINSWAKFGGMNCCMIIAWVNQ